MEKSDKESESQLLHPGANKVVSIADEPETISPRVKGKADDLDLAVEALDLDRPSQKQFRASVSAKRLSGRLSVERAGSSKQAALSAALSPEGINDSEGHQSRHIFQHHHASDNFITQISAWLKQEKNRRALRKFKHKAVKHEAKDQEAIVVDASASLPDEGSSDRRRRESELSEGSVALNELESILEKAMAITAIEKIASRKGAHPPRRMSSGMKLRRKSTAGSSDTDYFDGDAIVPSCDAILDNSKTMSYFEGRPDQTSGRNTPKEKDAWAIFKYEIVRLAHTLRLKGWRRVPMDRSGEIDVERLSGALTNAVYVVSPPKNLPPQNTTTSGSQEEPPAPRKPPPKLLLRVYGPQVGHLIDREAELQILRRLGRKRIGPRLLGTFTNGRFEEFLYARALTSADLRVPETSKQIAKRMRELHDGMHLTPQERADGAFVFRSWDKWVDRCEHVTTWLDEQILNTDTASVKSKADSWKKHGFICGVEWKVFRQTIERYRKWLIEQYGGPDALHDRLVFAHNDTQYGNILRLQPPGESPLLLPANEHKQLVVIDFEYANANLPGLEFANHFTEWCYNYHDPANPHSINTSLYPTKDEQQRFIRAYVTHRPRFPPSASSPTPSQPNTPLVRPSEGSSSNLFPSSSSISAFNLDSRVPPSFVMEAEEREEQEIVATINHLLAEAKLWRLSCSAFWVAWGIVQAKVPGLPGPGEKGEQLAKEQSTDCPQPEQEAMASDLAAKCPESEEEDAGDDEFDYLSYARERAMFLWGDAVQLGIVKLEDLPEDLRKKIKIVEY